MNYLSGIFLYYSDSRLTKEVPIGKSFNFVSDLLVSKYEYKQLYTFFLYLDIYTRDMKDF